MEVYLLPRPLGRRTRARGRGPSCSPRPCGGRPRSLPLHRAALGALRPPLPRPLSPVGPHGFLDPGNRAKSLFVAEQYLPFAQE